MLKAQVISISLFIFYMVPNITARTGFTGIRSPKCANELNSFAACSDLCLVFSTKDERGDAAKLLSQCFVHFDAFPLYSSDGNHKVHFRLRWQSKVTIIIISSMP